MASILLGTCIILFLIPWVILGIWIVRKRIKQNRIKMQKEMQQQQLLRVSEYGRQIRRAMRGPNGEEFTDVDIREARFAKVDTLARERPFSMLNDTKRSQTTCAICVEDFVPEDLVRSTQCNHVFHSQCLMMWAKSKIWANVRRIGQPACPNCNASLLEVPKISKILPIDEVAMSDDPIEVLNSRGRSPQNMENNLIQLDTQVNQSRIPANNLNQEVTLQRFNDENDALQDDNFDRNEYVTGSVGNLLNGRPSIVEQEDGAQDELQDMSPISGGNF